MRVVVFVAVAVVVSVSVLAGGASGQLVNSWTGSSSGRWDDATKWSVAEPTVGELVLFVAGGVSSPLTVTVDNTTASILTLTVGSDAAAAPDRTLTVDSGGALRVLLEATVAPSGTIIVNAGGVLDIGDGLMVVKGKLVMNGGTLLGRGSAANGVTFVSGPSASLAFHAPSLIDSRRIVATNGSSIHWASMPILLANSEANAMASLWVTSSSSLQLMPTLDASPANASILAVDGDSLPLPLPSSTLPAAGSCAAAPHGAVAFTSGGSLVVPTPDTVVSLGVPLSLDSGASVVMGAVGASVTLDCGSSLTLGASTAVSGPSDATFVVASSVSDPVTVTGPGNTVAGTIAASSFVVNVTHPAGIVFASSSAASPAGWTVASGASLTVLGGNVTGSAALANETLVVDGASAALNLDATQVSAGGPAYLGGLTVSASSGAAIAWSGAYTVAPGLAVVDLNGGFLAMAPSAAWILDVPADGSVSDPAAWPSMTLRASAQLTMESVGAAGAVAFDPTVIPTVATPGLSVLAASLDVDATSTVNLAGPNALLMAGPSSHVDGTVTFGASTAGLVLGCPDSLPGCGPLPERTHTLAARLDNTAGGGSGGLVAAMGDGVHLVLAASAAAPAPPPPAFTNGAVWVGRGARLDLEPGLPFAPSLIAVAGPESTRLNIVGGPFTQPTLQLAAVAGVATGGTVNITAGAALSVSTLLSWDSGSVVVGSGASMTLEASGSGTLTSAGPQSLVGGPFAIRGSMLGSGTGAPLLLDASASIDVTGTLTLSDAKTLSAAVPVEAAAGPLPALTVGAGGTLAVAASATPTVALVFDHSQGTGTVAVAAGGVLGLHGACTVAGPVALGSSSGVVFGADASGVGAAAAHMGAAATVSGTGTITAAGSTTVTVASGASVAVSGVGVAESGVLILPASVDVSNLATLAVHDQGVMYVSGSAVGVSSRFSWSSGTVSSRTGPAASAGPSPAPTLTVAATSTLELTDKATGPGLTRVLDGFIASVGGAGVWTASGTATHAAPLLVSDTSSLTLVAGGSLEVSSMYASMTGPGALVLAPSSRLNVSTETGQLSVSTAASTMNGAVELAAGGATLELLGPVLTTSMAAAVSGPGTLSLAGTWTVAVSPSAVAGRLAVGSTGAVHLADGVDLSVEGGGVCDGRFVVTGPSGTLTFSSPLYELGPTSSVEPAGAAEGSVVFGPGTTRVSGVYGFTTLNVSSSAALVSLDGDSPLAVSRAALSAGMLGVGRPVSVTEVFEWTSGGSIVRGVGSSATLTLAGAAVLSGGSHGVGAGVTVVVGGTVARDPASSTLEMGSGSALLCGTGCTGVVLDGTVVAADGVGSTPLPQVGALDGGVLTLGSGGMSGDGWDVVSRDGGRVEIAAGAHVSLGVGYVRTTTTTNSSGTQPSGVILLGGDTVLSGAGADVASGVVGGVGTLELASGCVVGEGGTLAASVPESASAEGAVGLSVVGPSVRVSGGRLLVDGALGRALSLSGALVVAASPVTVEVGTEGLGADGEWHPSRGTVFPVVEYVGGLEDARVSTRSAAGSLGDAFALETPLALPSRVRVGQTQLDVLYSAGCESSCHAAGDCEPFSGTCDCYAGFSGSNCQVNVVGLGLVLPLAVVGFCGGIALGYAAWVAKRRAQSSDAGAAGDTESKLRALGVVPLVPAEPAAPIAPIAPPLDNDQDTPLESDTGSASGGSGGSYSTDGDGDDGDYGVHNDTSRLETMSSYYYSEETASSGSDGSGDGGGVVPIAPLEGPVVGSSTPTRQRAY